MTFLILGVKVRAERQIRAKRHIGHLSLRVRMETQTHATKYIQNISLAEGEGRNTHKHLWRFYICEIHVTTFISVQGN
jgi:hypothetical protein